MKKSNMKTFIKVILLTILSQIFFHCRGKKMPEEVPLTLLIENPNTIHTLENYFQDELIRCLDRNNLKTSKSSNPDNMYYLKVVDSDFNQTYQRETIYLDEACDQHTLEFEVPNYSFSFTIQLFKYNQLINSWSFSESKTGKVKSNFLKEGNCDYWLKSPPSFETMLDRCARKARRYIANQVYVLEFK